MAKIYATLAALLLCGVSSQAAINVTLNDGTPITDGQTVTVSRSDFTHTYWEGLIDQWTGKVHITVESTTPTSVNLKGTSADLMFCPVGENCYNLFENASGDFEGNGTISSSPINIDVDMNYFNVGDNLPAEINTLEATLTDAAGAKFVVNFVFDTNDDTGVDGIKSDGLVNVYSIAGYNLLKNAPAESLKSLPAGLYIVNGKKIIIK